MSSPLFATKRVLWLPLDYPWQINPPEAHCCRTMAQSLEMACDQHGDPFECPDVALIHHDLFGEYGIPIRDGGPSYIVIVHCPWCGTALPASARDAWFDAVDAAGLADMPTADLPELYRTSAFRKLLRS